MKKFQYFTIINLIAYVRSGDHSREKILKKMRNINIRLSLSCFMSLSFSEKLPSSNHEMIMRAAKSESRAFEIGIANAKAMKK
ncbi:MAG: hypothetical protein COA39_011320 [Sulfurimonas sp.]|nr:hypothetical protein [Sulfurimonas sp.]